MTRRGFTLVELLVSTALILVVVTVATAATVQLLAQTRRLQSRLHLDASASIAHAKLNSEVTSMHPCAAVWLSSSTSGSVKSVELVFMRGTFSTLDWPSVVPPAQGSSKRMNTTEQFWTRWSWRSDTRELQVAASRPIRFFRIAANQARNYWKIPGGSKMPGGLFSTFVSIPQLQRETGTTTSPNSPEDLLNTNAWQSGEARDIGDYQDLVLASRPLLTECSDLSIELGNLDGATKLADGSPLQWAAPGTYVDAQEQTGLTDRPSLVRLRFTLTDPKTGAVGTYSFSCSTPSQTAY